MKLIAAGFKHGRFVFVMDKPYEVPAEFGGYFRANGWARDPKPDEMQLEFYPVDIRLLDANAPTPPKPAAQGEVQTLTVDDVKKVSADDLLGASKKP